MCNIQITGVNGTSSSPFTISISGTAEDCQDVVVNLKCASFDDKVLIPVANGIWSTSFDSTCPCGTEAEITVVCNTDPSCNASFFGTIPCDCCPTVIVSPKYSKCINGQYTVQLSTQLFIPDGCEPAQVYWDFGNGDIGGGSTFTTSGYHYFSAISSYLPGDYIAKLIFTIPDNCIPFEYPIHLNPCPPLECCPEISFEVSEQECISNDESEVTITTTITIPEGCHDAQIRTNFGDGTNGTVYTASAGVTTVQTETHAYQEGGSYSISASILQPSGCNSPKKIIKIEECEPCNFGWLKIICQLLIGIMTSALAMMILMLILFICSQIQELLIISAISLGVFILIAPIYYLVCRKCLTCLWWLFLLWSIILPTGIVIFLYSYGVECCLTNLFLGIGLMIIGSILMFIWFYHCSQFYCNSMINLAILFNLFILPAIYLVDQYAQTFLPCFQSDYYLYFQIADVAISLIALICLLISIFSTRR